MQSELTGKRRWIFKFKFLNKQRLLIFRSTAILVFLVVASFILMAGLNLKHIYYVMPFFIIPIFMVYPHAINKIRLEQLYVDLPKEIKPEYEKFVKTYAKYLLLIQFVFKKQITYDEAKIIELVENYNDKNKTL